MHSVMDARKRVDDATHKAHHEYIARCIARDKHRDERWEKVRTHVIGWGAVTAIGGMVYTLGEGIKQFFLNAMKAKGGP